MYKNILVAVDGSEVANRALIEAVKLAKDQQSRLIILHIAEEYFINYAGMYIDFAQYESAIKEHAFQILNQAENLARQYKIDFETRLIELKTPERVEEKIIEEIKNNSADLLVLGTHGRHGFNRLLLGSVAEGAVRISPVPILLVKGTGSKD